MMQASPSRSPDRTTSEKSTSSKSQVERSELRAVRQSYRSQASGLHGNPLPIRPRAIPLEQQLELLRHKSGRCPACFQTTCRLNSHKFYGLKLQARKTAHFKRAAELVNSQVQSSRPDHRFLRSYAHLMACVFVDNDVELARINLIRHLPLPMEYLTAENCRLFRNWFLSGPTYDLSISRPPTLVAEPFHGLFLGPSMKDTGLCFSILASAAAFCASNDPSSRHLRVPALTYAGLAMQNMRESLDQENGHPSDVVIATAAILCTVQLYFRDEESLKQHTEQVYTFVKIRGGMHFLGFAGLLDSYIRWNDILASLLLQSRCHFDNVPLSTIISAPKEPQHGIFWNWTDTNEHLAHVDSALVSACQKACNFLDTLDKFGNSPPASLDYWITIDHLQAIVNSDSVFLPSYKNSRNVNECLTLALYIIKVKAFWNTTPHQAALLTTSGNSLLTAVRNCGGPSFWKSNLSLFIWFLFTLQLVENQYQSSELSQDMLCESLNIRFGSNDLEQWPEDWKEQIEQGLMRFIWSRQRFCNRYITTCETIEAMHDSDSDDNS